MKGQTRSPNTVRALSKGLLMPEPVPPVTLKFFNEPRFHPYLYSHAFILLLT